MEELKPCPFCGSGVSEVHPNGRVWTGMRWGEPSSVSVRHWCAETPGQPQRMLERVGRDEAGALAAWNLRWLPVFDADRVAAEADNKPPNVEANRL